MVLRGSALRRMERLGRTCGLELSAFGHLDVLVVYGILGCVRSRLGRIRSKLAQFERFRIGGRFVSRDRRGGSGSVGFLAGKRRLIEKVARPVVLADGQRTAAADRQA